MPRLNPDRDPNYSPEWEAALHILNSPTFAHDPRVQQHVNETLLDFDEILNDRTFSFTERHLLELADSLFRQQRSFNVGRAFNFMDGPQADVAFEALHIFTRRQLPGS